MKTPDMAKENNFVLREAAKAAQMGYFDHLSAGGKGDPAEERWIEALTAGADAIMYVAVLDSRLAQVERERDAVMAYLKEAGCEHCKHSPSPNDIYIRDECCDCVRHCNFEWRGVCKENTKDDSK